jgi:hypothetical protein
MAYTLRQSDSEENRTSRHGSCRSASTPCVRRIHPLLRTLLLVHEFVALAGRHVDVRVGAAVTATSPRGTKADAETVRLRALLYALGHVG